MADLWQEVNQILLRDNDKLKISDIKDDIIWLYLRRQLKEPEIKLYESPKVFNKSINEYDHKYGLKNEIEFIVYHTENNTSNDITRYCNFIKKGIFEARFNDHIAHVLMLPKKILIDDKNEFHSLKGAAIQWHDKTADKYYIHGRRFSKKLFFQVKDRKLSMLSVMKIKNIEQRYITLQLYGIDKLMSELHPELINESKKGNKLYSYKVDEDLTLNFLLYSCPSTKNTYTKFVDPFTHNNNADKAMAISHNMSLEAYLSMEHEG